MNKTNLLKCIYTRRSIRLYIKSKKVSRKVLEKIIEAGLRAPSSKNCQPWYLLVLQGEEKDNVCLWVEETRDTANWEIPEVLDAMTNTQKAKSQYNSINDTLKFIRQSSALILVFNRGPFSGGNARRGQDPDRDVLLINEHIAIGACMENILLAIHSLGLGGAPIRDIWPAEERIKQEFGVDYDLVVGITVGYPAMNVPKRTVDKENFTRFV
jgi:nitroreductase